MGSLETKASLFLFFCVCKIGSGVYWLLWLKTRLYSANLTQAGSAICPGDHDWECICPSSYFDELLLSYVFKFECICMKLEQVLHLQDMDLIRTWKLELDHAWGLNPTFLHVGADGHDNLSVWIPVTVSHTCLESRLGITWGQRQKVLLETAVSRVP